MSEYRNEQRMLETLYVKSTGRQFFKVDHIDDYSKHNTHGFMSKRAQVATIDDKANLVGSSTETGMHMPVIDCDYAVQLVESSTPGHYHLYIDKEITWEQYQALLNGFYQAGLIEKAWYDNAIRDKRTYVRLPHVKKPQPGTPEPVLLDNDWLGLNP